MSDCKEIRIVDIAKMAGVSVGTVDRVIHNRGRVSAANYTRVMTVLKEVDYRPNMVARSLASKKVYHIVVIIPAYAPGEYWEYISRGVDRAVEDFRQYHLSVTKLYFDQFNEASFESLLRDIKLDEVDGVLLGTLFYDLVCSFSKELDARKIPYVYVDSDIPGERRMAFIGTDSLVGGQIAARILFRNITKEADILMARIVHTGAESTQAKNRLSGFNAYLTSIDYKGCMYRVDLDLSDDRHNYEILDAIFHEHPNIKAVVIFNSKAYIVGEYLKNRKRKDISLVGYDLIEKNAQLLEEGYIEALIDQRPRMQGYMGVKLLCERLILNVEIGNNNLLPIDILIKENYKFSETY